MYQAISNLSGSRWAYNIQNSLNYLTLVKQKYYNVLVIIDPPLTSFTPLSKNEETKRGRKVTHEMWHMTCDMWHVTCDMRPVGEREPFFPNFRSLDLMAWDVWCFKDWVEKGSVTRWMNQSIIDKGVCRKAPATPDLLSWRGSPVGTRPFPRPLHH